MQPDRTVLLEFLAWLEAGGVIPSSEGSLVDEFLADRLSYVSDLVHGPDLDIQTPGLRVTVRGAVQASLVCRETKEPGTGREFVIVRTPAGDPVMLLGESPSSD